MDIVTEDLTIRLRADEVERLRNLASKFGQTPEELIGGFIADLTNSDGSNGEDEHEAAMTWFRLLRSKWG